MATRIVGNAWVRIRALTDSLDREINQAFSKSKMSKLGDDIGKDISDGISKSIADSTDDINKSLHDIGKDSDSLVIDVSVDKSNAHLELLKLRKEISDLSATIDVDMDADVSDGFKKKISALVDELNSDLHKGIELDADVSRDTLHRVKEKFEDLRKDIEDQEVEIRPSIHYPMLKYVQARLLALTRNRSVTIFTQLDMASYQKVLTFIAALSGVRALQNVWERMRDWFKELDKNIPKLALILEGLGLIAAMALTASSNVLAFVASLAEVTFAGLLLPGVIAGFAFGVGSLVAVLKDARMYLSDVVTSFTDLQDTMSVNFWSIAQEPIRGLVNALLPALNTGLTLTSRSLGRFAVALSDSFTTHLSTGQMEKMFRNLALSIDITATYADDFGRIIENLGTLGSSYLPRLAQWFGEISRTFANWLELNRDSGQLTEWMELGIRRTKELGNVIRYTTSIIYNLGKAAEEAGGSSLTTLANTLRRVADVVKGEPFQTEITKTFEAAHTAMTLAARQGGKEFKDMMQGLVPVVQTVLPLVGQAIGSLVEGVSNALNTPGFKNGLTDMFRDLRDAIRELEPMWVPLGNGIGALAQIIGGLAQNFAPLLARMFTSLSTIIIALEPLIIALSDALSEMLLVTLNALLPVVEFFAKALAAVPAEAMVPIIITLAAAIKLLMMEMKADTVTRFALALTGGVIPLGNVLSGVKALGAALVALGPVFWGIAAGAAVLFGTIQMISNAGVMEKTADNFEQLLSGLDGSSESFDKVNNGFGRMNEAAKMASGEIASAASDAYGFSSSYETMANVSSHSAASITSLGEAMRVVAEKTGNSFWENLLGIGDSGHIFGIHSAALNQAKEDLAAFDQAAADVVNSGNMDQIAELERFVATEIAKTGKTREEVLAGLPKYSEALEAHEVALERAAEEERILAESARLAAIETVLFHDAIVEFNGVTPAMMQSINEGSKAFMSFTDAIKAGTSDAGFSLDTFMETLREQAAAQAEWADNMVLVGERASTGLVNELARLGPEAAPLVAEMVTMSDAELAEMEDLFLRTSQGVVSDMNSNFGQLNADMAAKLSGLNLTAIDSSGRLEETFKSLGYTVKDGILTGMSGIPGGMAGVLGSIDLMELDPSGRLAQVFRDLGYEVTNGMITGMREQEVSEAFTPIADTIIAGARSHLEIQSPSRVFARIGNDVVNGFVVGIGEQQSTVTTAGDSIITTLLSVFLPQAPTLLQPSGTSMISGFIQAILGGDTRTPGTTKTRELREGVDSSNLYGSGKSKVESLVSGFGSVSMSPYGYNAATGIRSGVDDTSKLFLKSGSSIGSTFGGSFTSTMGGVDSYSSGVSIASRLASGLRSMLRTVGDAASALAAKVKAYLPSSPAKEGAFSGKNWGGWGEAIGQELANGLLAQRDIVARASQQLMDSVDLTAEPSNISAPILSTYTNNRANESALAYQVALTNTPNSGDTYTVSISVDVQDLEGIRTVEEFADKVKLWTMMGR